jgi:HAD superfamily hydrolase (TIGR01549 family)
MIVKVIALDFDGVVLESNSAKTEAFEQLSNAYPLEATEFMSFHRSNVSLPRRAKFAKLAEQLGRDGDLALIEDMENSFSTLVKRKVVSSQRVEGLDDFLGNFEHLPLYIVSHTPQDELIAILKETGLYPHFSGIYGCPPHTKVDALRDIASRESILLEQIVFVGDAQSDAQAATETGVVFVGRDSGLDLGGCPTVFEDMRGVTQYLRALLTLNR